MFPALSTLFIACCSLSRLVGITHLYVRIPVQQVLATKIQKHKVAESPGDPLCLSAFVAIKNMA